MIQCRNTVPQILFLKGVYLSDLNVCAGPKRKEASQWSSAGGSSLKAYIEPPVEFTGPETWPTFTNLICHHCGIMPKEYPRFVPMSPSRDASGRFRCRAIGVFNTWNCAAAYINTEIPERLREESRKLLCLVEAMFTGKRRLYIPAAPPRTRMREYCGASGMTAAEYEAAISELNRQAAIDAP